MKATLSSQTMPTINPDAYPSILEVIEEGCQKFGSKPAFSCLGHVLSFTEIEKESRAFAAYLQTIPDLKPGDAIAIQLPNVLQFPIALFGALRAGLVVVNTNPLYTPREMEHQFRDSGAKAIVILANFASNLEQVLPKLNIPTVIVTELADMLPAPKRILINSVVKYLKKMVPAFSLPKMITFRGALAIGEKKTFQRVKRIGSDLAFIQYTGGTTGVSKGAMLTHRNLVANMEQVAACLKASLKEGDDVCLAPLPLYHVFSLTANALALFKYGAHNVLIPNPRDIKGFIKTMRSTRFTLMTGVNTLFKALMNHPDFSKVDFSHLKFSVGGAMALQSAVFEEWKKRTGSLLIEGYGLTEAAPVVCVNPLSPDLVKVGTVGIAVPSTEIKLMTASGEAPPGEAGEIWIRGPQVMAGYWKKPEETKIALPGDGWLRTGDVGVFTEGGFLKIVDRQKDMISVSGLKVYPNEVEDVLSQHPKILEVGVRGVEDEHSGEAVKAFVVKKDPSLTVEEIVAYSRQNLTAYKVPKQVAFVEALPKNTVGKILRRELK